MPPSSNHVCVCVAKGCNVFLDGATGQMGRQLTVSQFAVHQRAERSRIMADSMHQVRAEVLHQLEAKLADAPTSPTTLSATASNYRREKEKKFLRFVSPIEDGLRTVEADLANLPIDGDQELSDDEITHRMRSVQDLLDRSGKLYSDLEAVRKSQPRSIYTPGTKVMISEMMSRIDCLLSRLDNKRRWYRRILKRRHLNFERSKAAIPGFYDTSKHSLSEVLFSSFTVLRR